MHAYEETAQPQPADLHFSISDNSAALNQGKYCEKNKTPPPPKNNNNNNNSSNNNNNVIIIINIFIINNDNSNFINDNERIKEEKEPWFQLSHLL